MSCVLLSDPIPVEGMFKVGLFDNSHSNQSVVLTMGCRAQRRTTWHVLLEIPHECNECLSLANIDVFTLEQERSSLPEQLFLSFELKDGEHLTAPIRTLTGNPQQFMSGNEGRRPLHFLDCSLTDDHSLAMPEVNTPRTDPAVCADAVEIAMCIAEEVARLSDAPNPVPTDMPLPFADMDAMAVQRLQSWLLTRYDWPEDISLLSDPHVSPEKLASNIVDTLSSISTQTVNVPAGVMSTTRTKKPRRLHPRRNLSVTVPEPELAILIPTTSSVTSPERSTVLPCYSPAHFTTPPSNVDETVLDMGMAPYESWTGKKTGMIVGLMALGAFFGSPTSTSFKAARHQRTPLGLGDPSLLLDIRSPPVEHTSILSPWLDVLHFHGCEPVQSPWVADGAQSNFPLSP
ncbi:unnamed protein product [Somion occarium]|uniref:Uncharacterized protein n=1 Tax=Somion occarium TaxID=3059160 RepID=A0ABP1DUE4_9APHY